MKIWEVVFFIPFAYGLYLFVKAPLNAKYDLATWSDPAAGILLTLVSAFYFYLAHFSAGLVPAGANEPCGIFSTQIACYNLSETSCMAAWSSSRGGCDERLEQIIKSRPSFLGGNFLEMCIGKNFDKTMHYNRKNLSSINCQNYFNKIDKTE